MCCFLTFSRDVLETHASAHDELECFLYVLNLLYTHFGVLLISAQGLGRQHLAQLDQEDSTLECALQLLRFEAPLGQMHVYPFGERLIMEEEEEVKGNGLSFYS